MIISKPCLFHENCTVYNVFHLHHIQRIHVSSLERDLCWVERIIHGTFGDFLRAERRIALTPKALYNRLRPFVPEEFKHGKNNEKGGVLF